MNSVYILLGGNLGDRENNLFRATQQLSEQIGTITRTSLLYETAAWGVENQPNFLNQVILVESTINAEEILSINQAIEKYLGRKRYQKWHERTIDIDILYFNNEIINQENLTVPHPYLHERKFTLAPLVEISNNFVHPIFKKSNEQLLHECKDPLPVMVFNPKEV